MWSQSGSPEQGFGGTGQNVNGVAEKGRCCPLRLSRTLINFVCEGCEFHSALRLYTINVFNHRTADTIEQRICIPIPNSAFRLLISNPHVNSDNLCARIILYVLEKKSIFLVL